MMSADRQARLALEDAMVRELAGRVDSAILRIMNVPVTHEEALALVAAVRAKALELFPDKRHVFDLVYLPRFRRTITTFVRKPREPAGQ